MADYGMISHIPRILAPAGDKNSFLAAVAAGADAIYCGLKIFSARMEADNFSIEELARLASLAKAKNIEIYIAFNSIIKESEIDKVSIIPVVKSLQGRNIPGRER